MKYLWNVNNIRRTYTTLSVSDIQERCNSLDLKEGKIGVPPHPDKMRKSSVAFLDSSTSKDLFDLMWNLASEINKDAFGFDIKAVDDIQYGEYTEDGKYDWHIDTHWTTPDYHRKISVVIQLSDSNEYEGGDFEIDWDGWEDWKQGAREKGTIIIFPSFIRHRVTPVTKGTRKSLIAWIGGEKFR